MTEPETTMNERLGCAAFAVSLVFSIALIVAALATVAGVSAAAWWAVATSLKAFGALKTVSLCLYVVGVILAALNMALAMRARNSAAAFAWATGIVWIISAMIATIA